jgi:hypothetical protein
LGSHASASGSPSNIVSAMDLLPSMILSSGKAED